MNLALVQFLITLKNNSQLGREYCRILYTRQIHAVVIFLYKEGLIQSYLMESANKKFCIKIFLRYYNGIGTLSRLKLLSRPSHGQYCTYKELCSLPTLNSTIVLATSGGYATGLTCQQQRCGGLLCFVC
jgi:ribosomal protein S8